MQKVSILIPVYNSEKYLAETIESALNQTYKNIEIIIVDDGSTNNSLQIAKKYEFEKEKVFSQINSGAPKARNLAFEKSSGDFIQYLDADDLLALNKIESHIEQIKNYGKGNVYFCPHTRNYDEFLKGVCFEQDINRDFESPINLFIANFNGKGNVQTASWLVPREFIKQAGPWNEKLIKAQDGEFFLRVALQSKRLIFNKYTVVYYRKSGPQSITNNHNSEALKSVILSVELTHNTIIKYEDSEQIRQGLIMLNSKVFCAYYNKKNAFLLQKLEQKILSLNGRIIFNGNEKFKFIAYLIGVKNTLQIKSFLKKIIKMTSIV